MATVGLRLGGECSGVDHEADEIFRGERFRCGER